MKKKLVLLGILLIIAGLGIFFVTRNLFGKGSPTQDLGVKQILKNESSTVKIINIKEAGYYDITTLKANEVEKSSSQIPDLDKTRRGQYFNKNESVSLNSGEEVIFNPAKFEKIPESNNAYILTDTGNYLIGEQFPSGEYTISFEGELTAWTDKSGNVTQGEVQIVVYAPENVKDSESFQVTDDKQNIKIKLKNKRFLAIKTTNPNVSVVLTPVK
ncbi:hypothetical protein RyT2_10260 [Pseudolactococcus yaeyamensis]